jgi:hypothetical protein
VQAALASRPSPEEFKEVQEQLRTAETLLDAQLTAEGLGTAGGATPPGGGGDPTQSLVSILQVCSSVNGSEN